MRVTRLAWLSLLACVVAAAPARAATLAPRVVLVVQPTRADFDRDGRPDVAVVRIGSNPNLVRVVLSRAGSRELPHANAVLAIASFDYDHDGDVDLFVGTSAGTTVWLNDGQGAFSALSDQQGAAPAPLSPDLLRATLQARVSPLDRDEPMLARTSGAVHAGDPVGDFMAPALRSFTSVLLVSLGFPRAPPRV